MRFLTTTQLARLVFGGSRWAANKRLRKLLDAGLIRSWVRDLAEDNVYSLDRKGLGVLDDPDLGMNHTVARGLDGNLTHLLSINQVRIAFALGLPAVGGELSLWRSDWELQAESRARLIPDALFAIRWEQGEAQSFALEVDNHTKSVRAFVKKILAYASVTTRGLYGFTDFVTLVIGRDPEWLERYRSALANLGLGARIWFALLSDLEEGWAGATIWRTAEGDGQHSLRTLATLPYSEEDHAAESATPSGT